MKSPLLNINLYINLCNLTIFVIYVFLFLQNKLNPVRMVTPYFRHHFL